MPRRAATLATAAALIIVLAIGAAYLPVPYVALGPGPTKNVLGAQNGKPLITIDGHKIYKDEGHLNLVTVQYWGGPGDRMNLFSAVSGWVNPDVAVVPQQELFPSGESAKQVQRAASRKMRRSQDEATAAALCELDIPVHPHTTVEKVLNGFPADGVLRRGDSLLAVDGEKLDSCGEVVRLVSSTTPGQTVRMTVRREGEKKRLEVPTTRAKGESGKAVIGILLTTTYDYPFDVRIRINHIGGPSAGTMFAIGIVDKLTPGDLSGGKFIAGTGTIDPDGAVGKIGGIAQKMLGARSDGATVFLTPAGNCEDAKGAKPPGLRLVKVKTLHGALQALRALKSGHGNVPSC